MNNPYIRIPLLPNGSVIRSAPVAPTGPDRSGHRRLVIGGRRKLTAPRIALVCAFFSLTAVCAEPSSRQAGLQPQVVRETLTNGLRVIVVKNPLSPVVTTMLNYRVGSDEAPAGFPGTAHALEHMMFRGSPGLNAAQLAEISAALGGDSNADTQQGVTQYFFTVPAQDLELALHIEATRMRAILNTTNLWDQERGAIEQEVAQDFSNPEYVFYMKLLEILFKGTPYEHDALGTRPSFDKTTAAMLRNFHDTWYAPNNAVLIIVGDIQPGRAIEQVKKLFADIPSRPLPARPEYHFQSVQAQTIQLETDAPQGMAVLAFRLPGSDSPDYAALQVLSDVLSSKRGPLYGLVPEGKALDSSFEYDGLIRSGLGFAAAEFPAGADTRSLLNSVRAILAGQITNGVMPELVEAAKRREILSAELERNSVMGLAMEWSQAVAVEGRQSPDEDVDAIRRVTVADVNRVARQCLQLDHAVTAVLTPSPSGKPVSPKGFGGAESFSPTHPESVALPDWAAAAANRLEIPHSSLNPIVTNLPNGLKLIVQPESISDSVSVFGRVRSNPKIEEPPGQEGAAMTLAELFSYGTTTRDRLAFQKALDDIGALESAGTNFSLQVLPGNFEKGVQLLADNIISPALPEAALKVLRPELAAAVAGELQSPGYLARRALERALFPKQDPVQRQTTPATVKSLSVQDVRGYYERVFRPDLTTIVVAGKISPEKAQTVIARYFGAWKTTGAKPNTLFPAAPPNAPAVSVVPDASRVQDRVILAETLPLSRTNADYYALELGNHVLGGAFYATRLYRDLRENAGLVYFVGTQFAVGLTRGVYEVSYACDPPNVAKARAIILNDLRQMQQADVTPAELRQAKVLLLRHIPLAESSVARIANGWLDRVLLELPLDEPTRAAQKYLQLDAHSVRQAFSKWLRVPDLVQVSQGPAPG